MKWSKWSAAAVMMLAGAGAALSQAPTTQPKSAEGTAERIMTLHENGKAMRCRIVSSWKTKEGASAYQLQAIDSGEMITIVADGPDTTAADTANAKSLPMRIYHWGRNRVAPPGVPTNPETVNTTITAAPTPTTTALPVRTTPIMPVSATANTPVAQTTPPAPPVTTQPAKSTITTANVAPAAPTVSLPAAQPVTSSPPSKTVTTTKSPSASKEQTIWWEEKDGKRVSPIVVTNGKNPFENQPIVRDNSPIMLAPAQSEPVPVVVDKKGSTVVTLPPRDEPRMFTSSPTTRTVVQADTITSVTSTPMGKAGEEKIVVAPEKSPRLLQKLFGPKPSASQPEEIIVSTTPVVPAGKSSSSFVQSGPTVLPSKTISSPTTTVATSTPTSMTPLAQNGSPVAPITTSGSIGSTATSTDAVPTTAAAATNSKVDTASTTPSKQSIFSKIGTMFQPKRNTDAARSLEAKESKDTDTAKAKAEDKSTSTTARTSTASMPFSTANDRSITEKSTQTASASYGSAGSSFGSQGMLPPPLTGSDTGASGGAKKDWRSMWGRANDKNQMPGQSKTDVAAAPQGDILLNPEKFDPAGNKLVPRGINMSAYRGDPNQLMTKNQTGDQQVPPGYQSVIAAGNAQMNMAYVPVPSGQSPDSSRAANAPVNAFTPPPSTMPTNAFSNRNAPPQMAQGYPPAGPPAYLPAPVPPSYPPAYPSFAAAPAPTPPPIAPAIQPTQYTPPPPAPMANPAMDRRQALPATPTAPSSELVQVLQVLRESPYPAQREWAANTMATYDWKAHPELVQVLLQVAQQDPAATVRASCVYSLGRMNAATEPVINVLRTLITDSDARVRDEVEQALVRLGAGKQR